MASLTQTDAKIAAPIGTRIDIEPAGIGIAAGVIDGDGRREVAA